MQMSQTLSTQKIAVRGQSLKQATKHVGPLAAAPRALPHHRAQVVVASSSSEEQGVTMSRRNVLAAVPAALVATTLSSGAQLVAPLAASALVMAKEGTKVVVLGGNGFVGSRVVEALVARGVEVVSVSKSGKPAPISSAPKVKWTAADVLTTDLSETYKGADAVISCIGVIGGSDEYMEKGNGDVNVKASAGAKAAGVPKFVYVSVASIVPGAVDGIALKGYFAGKRKAEAAIAADFPGSSVVIAPSFIYGGDSFVLNPPRVPAGYGSFIEGTLEAGPIRALAGVMPGVIGLTLAPPVSVDNVALSVVAGALDTVSAGKIDGTDAINTAAKTV